MVRRFSVALLSVLVLGTSCPGYWHSISVPTAATARAHEGTVRTQVVDVAERIALAHGLHLRPVPSPRCTPHWGMASTDSTGWYQTRGWPDVCVDTTHREALVVRMDAGERELEPGSRAERLWFALRDSLAPLGGTPRRQP
jgi:hypothetical protein